MKQETLNIGECRTVGGFMKDHLNKQLLRFAAGHCITCPNCGDILDCKRTVSAEIARNYKRQGREVINSYVVCGKCWDTVEASVREGIQRANARCAELNGELDLVDGRKLDWD